MSPMLDVCRWIGTTRVVRVTLKARLSRRPFGGATRQDRGKSASPSAGGTHQKPAADRALAHVTDAAEPVRSAHPSGSKGKNRTRGVMADYAVAP